MVPFVLSPGHRSEPVRWLCSRWRSHTLNLNDRWSNWKRKEYCFFCFKYEDESREYDFLRLLGRLWASIHWIFVICFSRCDFSSLSLQYLTYSDSMCSLLWGSINSVPECPLHDYHPVSSHPARFGFWCIHVLNCAILTYSRSTLPLLIPSHEAKICFQILTLVSIFIPSLPFPWVFQ